MQSRQRGWIILILFFCSGASALVYEVLWSKFLSDMFGSTIYAQTVVLASFMGGLAIGNRLLGIWADKLKRPLMFYGSLEIAVGVYAIFFPMLDRAVNGLFVILGGPLIEHHDGWLLGLKGGLAALLLLGPTILMGGTLPLIAAWLQKDSSDPGRRSARFYSVNTFGAVLGAAVAGFWLVQTYGMIKTLQIAAVTNLVIGILAVFLGRTEATEPAAHDESAAVRPEPVIAAPGTLRWAGLIVGLTGAVSMGLEVLASRSSGLIFGPSLQSFAVVLIAFILGIGLGSAWIASPRRRQWAGERMIVLLLCTAAAWVAGLVFNIELWVDYYRWACTGLARTGVGFIYYELFNTASALIVLGLPAALIGSVLPLMIRAVSASDTPLGNKVGILLTWNTLGAVAGTLLTGFVLMPWAGLRNAFAALALVLGLAALLVAWRRSRVAGITGAVAVCGLTIFVLISGDEGWRTIMSSGVFRMHENVYDKGLMAMWKKHMKLVFYQDAPDATVSVDEADGLMTPAVLGLRINGKADAGTRDMETQLLLAHLPMLSRPGAKDAFVLGMGSGITAGALLAYPLEHIDVGENCEPVIEAAKLFGDWNRHVESNPRVRVWNEDARTVLKLRPQRYDVIITEPSNPWTIGVGAVFSREFYEIAASRLRPGGLVCQWFHTYEMRDDLLTLILRTFGSVFPNMEIWDIGDGDLIILGSKQPWKSGPDVFAEGFSIPRVREDMRMIDIPSPDALMARQLASQQTAFAIAGAGRIQSDLFPVLEYEAPEAFYINSISLLLDRYDERTQQQLLAPQEKLVVLKSLPLENVQAIFKPASTDNKALWGCIFGYVTSTNVPCAFQTPITVPVPASSGTILDAAEKAFSAGNLAEARQWVDLALKQQPDNQMAGYVQRVVERAEKEQQAADSTQSRNQASRIQPKF